MDATAGSTATIAAPPRLDVTEHPLVHDVNEEHTASLSGTERFCKRIADSTGAPLALGLAVLIQAIWIPVGIATKWDPYPFAFLLTCSNVLQLILIFILAVGQRQSSAHAELRAEHDHDSISRLLYHQELQEKILIEIAGKIECDVSDIRTMVAQLAAQDSSP
ncbi:MAG TPA: DUF1003 domain-containing protein [Candidatus Elarobacter sp.]|jgi:uncharacterized membrane protein|nr:DUF1003 domain-containing protein [Candidatus Elarobacter sp.]